MDEELEQFAMRVRQAACAEDVFGLFEGSGDSRLEQAAAVYRNLVKVAHPDRYKHNGDQSTALEAFQSLQDWWQEAQVRIKDGTYGSRIHKSKVDPVLVHSGKRQYTVEDQMARGDFCNLYYCTVAGEPERAVFKVAVDPRDNDLLANEARVLRDIRASKRDAELYAYLPELQDAFSYKDSAGVTRRVNVLNELAGFYSLKQVRAEYRGGVSPRDMAWIWRRLLVVLGLAHVNGVIHGAVLPEHVLIHPEMHGLVLIDWTCAVTVDDASGPSLYIPAMSLDYEPWYPPEVKSKQAPLPGADIYMAVQCMIYLLGGDPATGAIPETTPKSLVRFFRGCLLPGPKARPQEAWKLLEEFDELIDKLWGKRTFHPFIMPNTSVPL